MKCVTLNAMKSKALVDLLAHFPSGEYEYVLPSEQNSQLQYWRKPTNFFGRINIYGHIFFRFPSPSPVK
ncbi:hypothetical protein Hanom_Chr03g00179011 [Helianthus anomalus]